jgi:hypothetical protein
MRGWNAVGLMIISRGYKLTPSNETHPGLVCPLSCDKAFFPVTNNQATARTS